VKNEAFQTIHLELSHQPIPLTSLRPTFQAPGPWRRWAEGSTLTGG
jgi:hypothetical protein